MPPRSNQNYRRILIGLINRGTTLCRWANDHGLPTSTVYAAAKGIRAGVKASQIKRKLETYIDGGGQ